MYGVRGVIGRGAWRDRPHDLQVCNAGVQIACRSSSSVRECDGKILALPVSMVHECHAANVCRGIVIRERLMGAGVKHHVRLALEFKIIGSVEESAFVLPLPNVDLRVRQRPAVDVGGNGLAAGRNVDPSLPRLFHRIGQIGKEEVVAQF